MTEQRRGAGQGRPPAKRSGASGGASRDPVGDGRAGREAFRRVGWGHPRRARWPAGSGRSSGPRVRGARGSVPAAGHRPRGKGGDRRDQGTRGGRGESARRVTGGGFGPYAVDQRDEETRDKRAPSVPTTARRARARGSARRCGRSASAPSATRSRGARGVGSPRRRPDVAASVAPPTCSRRWRRWRGATPIVRSARSWPRPMRSPTTGSARRCGSSGRCASSCPTHPSVRELTGLAQYRLGNYAAAAKELEAYADLSDSVDQNPVLMDCYRAQRRWRKVEALWLELAAVSPTAELVAEGRIVYAGALADQGGCPRRWPSCASAPTTSSRRRSTTSASGTRWPTSKSAPATLPAPASCSTRYGAPTPPSPTSPSASPPWADRLAGL